MRCRFFIPAVAAALVTTVSAAQADDSNNIYRGDPGRYGVFYQTLTGQKAVAAAPVSAGAAVDRNAVVNVGSGAVNPIGPGENPATAGIGGSGSTAPVAAYTSVVPPAVGVVPNAVVSYGSGAVGTWGPGDTTGSVATAGSAAPVGVSSPARLRRR